MPYNKIIQSDIFNTKKVTLLGKVLNEPISSYEFITQGFSGINKDLSVNSESFKIALYDFAATLKAIVKQEMIEEMQKRIDNLDTFYR